VIEINKINSKSIKYPKKKKKKKKVTVDDLNAQLAVATVT